MAMCVSAGSQMFWSCVDKQQFVQASGGSGDKRERGGRTGQRGRVRAVTARRSGRGTGSTGRLFSQLGVAACAKHLTPVNIKTGVGTLCQEDDVLPGVSAAHFINSWSQGTHVMPSRSKDVSKVSFLGENEAPSPVRLLIVTVPQISHGNSLEGHLHSERLLGF